MYMRKPKKGMERSQTLHQVFCVSFCITGSVNNFILILIVIYRGLFRESRFAFFLNFLMSSVYLPFWAVFTFLPAAAMESSIHCRSVVFKDTSSLSLEAL